MELRSDRLRVKYMLDRADIEYTEQSSEETHWSVMVLKKKDEPVSFVFNENGELVDIAL